MGWLDRWWRQSDHYDRPSSHLQARGMGILTRATIAVIAAADGAMYAAKRRGGNQTGHHHWPLPPRLDGFDADESDYRSDGLTA